MYRRVQMFFNERVLLNSLANGDYGRAERALDRIERIEGRTRGVLHNRAVIRMGQGEFAAAEALFDKQIEDYGDNPELLRAAAEAAYLGGDRANASRRIAAALADRDCPDRPLLERRAIICTNADQHARAMTGKKDFAAAVALLGKGDKDEAIKSFRRAVDADPSDFVALNNLGALLMNHRRDYNAASEVFAKALKLSDQSLVRANLAKAREAAEKKRAADKSAH